MEAVIDMYNENPIVLAIGPGQGVKSDAACKFLVKGLQLEKQQ